MIENFKEIEIDRLVKADWNYKVEDEELKEKLRNNIKRNGQIENIIVRELKSGYYEVINGNHRLDVMKELDHKKVVVFDCGKISIESAQRIAIETNESKFQTDDLLLAKVIKEIIDSGIFRVDELAETMPYSAEQLNNFQKLSDIDWDQYESDSHGSDSDRIDNLLELALTEDQYNLWEKWKNKLKEEMDINSDAKCFEIGISHALTIPDNKII